ncbi:MAG: class C sortase [Arcanobacterium sp.]|nr:class C sortase [Arcanobacterium sp.]
MPKPESSLRVLFWPRFIIAVLILAGITVTLSPVVSAFWNFEKTLKNSEKYLGTIAKESPEKLTESFFRAQEYNAKLNPQTINDPWKFANKTFDTDHADYLTQLRSEIDTSKTSEEQNYLGVITVPKINIQLPIKHDATPKSIADTAGHMYGSSLPVGGINTHTVIAAHSGGKQLFFDRLPELQIGDLFYLHVAGQTLSYKVDAKNIVENIDLSHVQRIPNGDFATLVTCVKSPDGKYFQRLLVRGERFETSLHSIGESSSASQSNNISIFSAYDSWMLPRIVISSLALFSLLIIIFSWLTPKRSAKEQ